MSIITLTTDFGHKDYFVSAIKAALLQESPQATVIDISHSISPFNHTEAAYILKNAYRNFPKGSIHILGVDSELSPENRHLVMYFDGHYFIGANNGVFALILDEMRYDNLVEINIHDKIISTFPVLDVFVKVAGHLSRSGALGIIGKSFEKLKDLTGVKPVLHDSGHQMVGSVIYIDNFGNVVTNIKKQQFLSIQKTRPFTIYAQSVKFTKIHETYAEAINFDLPKAQREEDGKKIALWNAAGHLELSIYKSNPKTVGSANSLFGLDFRTPIIIDFKH